MGTNYGQISNCIVIGLTFCKVGKFPPPKNLNKAKSKIPFNSSFRCDGETLENPPCFYCQCYFCRIQSFPKSCSFLSLIKHYPDLQLLVTEMSSMRAPT